MAKELNLHENFKDLNPTYAKMRFKRAKDLANHWENNLGVKIKKRVDVVAR